MAKSREVLSEKKLTGVALITLEKEMASFIHAEVTRLRTEYIQSFPHKKHTSEQLKESESIARKHGVRAANTYLEECRVANNPPRGPIPTRTSFIRELITLGYEVYRKQQKTAA